MILSTKPNGPLRTIVAVVLSVLYLFFKTNFINTIQVYIFLILHQTVFYINFNYLYIIYIFKFFKILN